MRWTRDDLDEGERVLSQPVQPTKDSDIRRETVRALMDLGRDRYLARLKPSGQVADDVERVARGLGKLVGEPPSGVGPYLDAFHRLAAGAQEAESLRARVKELEMENAALLGRPLSMDEREWVGDPIVAWRAYHNANEERDAAQADVKRLKAELALSENGRKRWKERALMAESRLAAIRERGANDAEALRRAEAAWVGVRDWDVDVHADVLDTGHLAHLGDAVQRAVRWVLEGDAPQEAKNCTCADNPEPGDDIPHLNGCPLKRYPCSPTCTHDDASTPGHPERVKERSEAFSDAVQAADNLAAGERGLQRAYENGAEAMRAACLEAVMKECGVFGLGPAAREALKAAIEGAAL
jgi:hypothetical protein